MAEKRSSSAKRRETAAMGKAMNVLTPPTDEMMISAEDKALARKVEAMSAKPGARRTAEIRRLIDSMTTRGDPSDVFLEIAGPLRTGILGSSVFPESLFKPSGSASPIVPSRRPS